jgi:HECT-domain (ubiquitin-transferase)
LYFSISHVTPNAATLLPHTLNTQTYTLSLQRAAEAEVHPEVARRVLDFLCFLAKSSARLTHGLLTEETPAVRSEVEAAMAATGTTTAATTATAGATTAAAVDEGVEESKGGDTMDTDDSTTAAATAAAAAAATKQKAVLLEQLLALLERPLYTMSSVNLDQLLQLLEVLVAPLNDIPEKQPEPEPAAAETAETAATTTAAAASPAAAADSGTTAAAQPAAEAAAAPAATDASAADTATAAATAAAAAAAPQDAAAAMDVVVAETAADTAPAPAAAPATAEARAATSFAAAAAGARDAAAARFHQRLSVFERPATAAAGGMPPPAAQVPRSFHEWVPIPTPTVHPARLRLLCSVLLLETCSEAAFARITHVLSALARVPANKDSLLQELLRVAGALGSSSAAGLQALAAQLSSGGAAAAAAALNVSSSASEVKLLRVLQTLRALAGKDGDVLEGLLSALPLQSLWDALSSCLQVVSQLEGVQSDSEETDSAAAVAAAAAGGSSSSPVPSSSGGGGAAAGAAGAGAAGGGAAAGIAEGGKAKQTSAMAGLLARFLPMVEAFFVVNARDVGKGGSSDAEAPTAAPTIATAGATTATAASGTEEAALASAVPLQRQMSSTAGLFDNLPGARFRKNVPRNMRPYVEADSSSDSSAAAAAAAAALSPEEALAAQQRARLGDFVARHRALLNALLHQNPALLDKSLSAMVQSARCRQHLDFGNKRAYFRAQLRRLRQHSTRRHGSLRLNVPRAQVFEYSFHQLRIRSAEEMRGRLHITFEGEEGVDAGGLTREWYGILAREIFNADYALFKAGADGVTFQPNPLSHINPDHLAYHKFVGRIVGKAIADGQLLDAHFTHSFYKHILGVPVTYQDMEAIDPTYYKNLVTILSMPLEVLGLELTFSAESNEFGRAVTVDLVPNGQNIAVDDTTKLAYVQRITHHRMTNAIRPQIEAFLEGFHELVPPELISIFTPQELELLISGLPDIDLDDLHANTEYQNYKPSDAPVQHFWSVLRSFTREEVCTLLLTLSLLLLVLLLLLQLVLLLV